MKTNNRRYAIGIGLITLTAIILLLNAGTLTAQQNPWLSGWAYRTPITITEKSGVALTDYQIKISVEKTHGMNSDFSDLRFTDTDKITPLNYWIEAYDSGIATVWIKVPSITASGTKTVYMYYGNSAATTASNGKATFPYFSGEGDTSAWTAGGYTIENNNGSLRIYGSVVSGSAAYNINPANTKYILQIKEKHSSPTNSLWLYQYMRTSTGTGLFGYGYAKYTDYDRVVLDYNSNLYDVYHGVSFDTTYYIHKLVIDETNSRVSAYMYDAGYGLLGSATEKSMLSGSLNKLEINDGSGAAGYVSIWIRYLLQREYASIEPTYALGSRETTYPQGINWLSGWAYRSPVNVTGVSGTALTNYQVKLIVNYDLDMKSDFSDLRFTDWDGGLLLPYWIESYTAGSTATVWVKVPSIPANGKTAVYMYYGNSGAGNIGSPKETFMIYDDFSTDTTSTWLKAASGQDSYTYDSANKRMNFYCRGRDNSPQYIAKKISIDPGVCAEADWRFTADPTNEYSNMFGTFLTSDLTKMISSTTQRGFGVFMYDDYDPGYTEERLYTYTVDTANTRVRNPVTADHGTTLYTHWFRTRVCHYNQNQFRMEVWEDGTNLVANTTYTINVAPINYVSFGDMMTYPVYGSYTANTPGWVDNIKIRKYTLGEPRVVIGIEETPNYAPVIESQELYPSTPTDADDLDLSVRCSDADTGDTLTAYWSCYKNDVLQSTYTGSATVVNNVEQSVEVIDNADTGPGQEWYCTAYCGDRRKYSATAATSTRTISTGPTCGMGSDCSLCTDWVNLNATGGINLQVRDGNGNGKYDQICCSGTVEAVTAI